MNIGIRLHDVAGATLEEKLQNAKAQGFSCVHLALSKVLPDFPMEKAPELLTPALAEELKALFAKYGLRIVVLGCYLNLATPDMEELQHTMEIYKAHLRFAPLLGAEVVGTETGNPNTAYALDENSHTEASLRLFMDRLAPLVRYAEECGAVLAIEPVCRHIVYTPQWAARVLAAFPTPHLRLILDMVNLMNMANYRQADQILKDAITLMGPRIHMLHIKDYLPREGEADVASLAAGQGCMDYTGLLAFARSRGLPMTLEDTVPENAEAARLYLENWPR